jgi:TolA-binding protein
LKRWADVVASADAYRADAPKDPQLADVEYARGRALQGLARFDDARAAFQAVIDARKGGDLAALAQWSLGETYFHQKNYRQAIREFLKVDILYDAPTWQAAALFEAGKAYEQLDQWADAAEMYERLRDKFPKDPKAAEAKSLLEGVRKRLASQPEAAKTADSGKP